MKNSKSLLASAIAGLVVLGIGAAATPAFAAKQGFEKCAGIVKAGKNDCGAKGHACAGKATKDGEGDEWIYLPKGACEKIVGGSLTAKS